MAKAEIVHDDSEPPGMIDLHCHILPGIDDGAVSVDESLELARSLAASGVRVVAATPHVSERYPTTPEQMENGLERVRRALAAAGIPIDVVRGAEVAFGQLERLDDETRRAFTLGGTGKFLLLEFPCDGWPGSFAERLAALTETGVGVVLAHPERNPLVQAAPQRLAGLVEAGTLVQVNAGSLMGAFGVAARAAARSLLDSGLAHVVASDSHRPRLRPTLAEAAAALPEPLSRWLTWDAPSAILAGERPPPPPRRRRRRFMR